MAAADAAATWHENELLGCFLFVILKNNVILTCPRISAAILQTQLTRKSCIAGGGHSTLHAALV